MSNPQIEATARAQITKFNDRDWDAIREINAVDVVYDEVATNRRIEGFDDALAAFQAWASAFPDVKGDIHNVIVAGNTAAVEVTWKGTHTGTLVTPAGEVPPTNKTVEIRACQVSEIENGQAKRVRHYFDMVTMMQQLGLSG